MRIEGKYQVKVPVPFTPGSEVAGEVVTADAGAPFRPGDRVFGATPTGAFAELALLEARENLKSRIRELTDGAARVVIDPVGGPYAEQALRGLARGGVFVTLGYAAGAIPAIPLNLILLKDITVRSMEIRTFNSDHPNDAARDTRELQKMFADGRIRPHIGARFPLSDTAATLRHVAARKAIGKVVIDVTA